MTIKFVSQGSVAGGVFKKRVLSNKALTSRVRGLSGTEGKRKYKEEKLYDGVTLVSNTADINYLAELNGLSNTIIHTLRFFINYVAVANGFTRIILFEDTDKGDTNLVVGEILSEAAPHATYVEDGTSIHPFSAKRLNKNLETTHRCRIIKDMLWSNNLNSGATKMTSRSFDVRYNGRKTDSRLEWGMLVISSAADTPININYGMDITDLSG